MIRAAVRPAARALTRRWDPGTRLFLVGEDVPWSINHDLRELAAIAGRLGIRVADRRLLSSSRGQAAFFGSHFQLLREPWRPPAHASATAYFHGRPGTPGMPEFDEAYRVLCRHHAELARIQVTHEEMHRLVLSSGIDPAKVFRIPIGINLDLFPRRTGAARAAARVELDLPDAAFVVGSFHKDGRGFADGLEPKLIKGPDVLLDAMRALRARVPELHVLLAGPARGFVRAGLERLGIPCRHRYASSYDEVAGLYAALDAYVVPSRQEGGPKGVLEAMASGVPLVTTRVGQAPELVRDGENGRLVDVEDAEALADRLAWIAAEPAAAAALVEAARATAEANTYTKQQSLWKGFFEGYVALGGRGTPSLS